MSVENKQENQGNPNRENSGTNQNQGTNANQGNQGNTNQGTNAANQGNQGNQQTNQGNPGSNQWNSADSQDNTNRNQENSRPNSGTGDDTAPFKITGNWEQQSSQLKEKYNQLTDSDLQFQPGQENQLLDTLGTKLNKSREEVINELNRFNA